DAFQNQNFLRARFPYNDNLGPPSNNGDRKKSEPDCPICAHNRWRCPDYRWQAARMRRQEAPSTPQRRPTSYVGISAYVNGSMPLKPFLAGNGHVKKP